MTTDELELERFVTIGRLSATLLHEISNPLTAALLNLELSQQRSPSVRRAKRNLHLLHRYVLAARQQVRHQSKQRSFWVQPQIGQLQPIIQPLARQNGARLIIELLPRCRLYGDPVKFQQIISNLLINALEAGLGVLKPQVKLAGQITRTHLLIDVEDQNGGIMTDDIFKEFVSVKTASNLGLGLSIVRRYVQEFGGDIEVHGIPGGSRFRLILPLSKF